MGEDLVCSLRYQRRFPRSGLGLLDIFVKLTLACYRPVGVVERLPGPRCRVCKVQGGSMTSLVTGTLGVALCRARRPQVAAVVPCRARGGQLVELPQGWRELASRSPRVRWGLVRLLLCANRRIDPLGWWVRVDVWCSTFCLVTGTRLLWFPPSRKAVSRASSPCLVSTQVGLRERPQPAPGSPLPHW